MALRRIEGKDAVLIHHSDRGCQYASREYVGLLLERGIRISMTESGGDRGMKWHSYRIEAIKSRDSLLMSEKPLPLHPCQGSPSGLRPPVNP